MDNKYISCNVWDSIDHEFIAKELFLKQYITIKIDQCFISKVPDG